MACDALTKSRARACSSNLAGNSILYLFDRTADAFTVSATTNEATAVNYAGAVYSYELENDGNTLSQAMVGDLNSGTRVNTQTATFVLPGMSVEDSAEFNLLAASGAQAVVKTRNGDYLALGNRAGLNWSITSDTGGAANDANGYTVVGVAQENTLAPYLDAATVTAFLLLVV